MEHMACIDWLRQPTLIKDRNRTLKTERNKISRNKSFEEFKLWKGAAAKGSATTIAYTIRNLKFLTVYICYFQRVNACFYSIFAANLKNHWLYCKSHRVAIMVVIIIYAKNNDCYIT